MLGADRRLGSLVLCGALAASAGAQPCAAADARDWERLARAARDAEARDDEAAALRAWRQAVAQARRPPPAPLLEAQALEGLADAALRFGRDAEAEAAYREAIAAWERAVGREQPRLGVPINNLAILLLRQCRAAEAEPWLRRLLELWRRDDRARARDRRAALLGAATLLRRCGDGDRAALYEAEARAPH